MKILSIHEGHDPNVSFLTEDTLVHIEQERISRIKHLHNNKSKKVIEKLIKDFDFDVIVSSMTENKDDVKIYTEFEDEYIPQNKQIYISHHLAHAAYVYYTRPEKIDKCDILAYDGWGMETDRYFYNESKKLIDTSTFGLGLLWELFSLRFFNKMHQEGKIMGMVAYGVFNKSIYKKYEDALNILQKLKITTDVNIVNEAKEVLKNIYYIYKVEDIAHTLQKFSENKTIEYLKKVKSSKTLLISGGIGLNGYINQKINSLYDEVYISPATSDSGVSVGGALLVANKRLPKPAYIGRQQNITENTLGIIKQLNLTHKKFNYDYIADKIIQGKIIALYQGHSESGPRALGNRSILADPRSGVVKEYINKYIKHREWYRPYAPAILEEEVSNWFEDLTASPYMLKIAKYKKGKGELVAGVCHKDYTGRVQSVSKEDNLKLYLLIETFFKRTGIPILLNTSFNIQEPIVDTPVDALKTFAKSNLDLLILEDYIIEKNNDRFIISNS